MVFEVLRRLKTGKTLIESRTPREERQEIAFSQEFCYFLDERGDKMRKNYLNLAWAGAFFLFFLGGLAFGNRAFAEPVKKSVSTFPILMYDTDIGLGYGGKAKFIHYLGRKESFDFILFNSSKGERWYVMTFSVPDFEIRQGKKYSLSLDIKAEYDKYLKYRYYGTGPDSKKDNETIFTFEKKELMLTIGRGFSRRFVAEGSYVLRNIHYFDIKEGPHSTALEMIGNQFSPFFSACIRYDTSDSQIHPTTGLRLLFQNDIAAAFLGNRKARYHRLTIDFRNYLSLFGRKDVLAVRSLVQYIAGKDVPLFELSVLGGGSTMTAMRGFGQNRYLDKGKFLFNAEYRFPIWRRLGGNVFADAGVVWPAWTRIDFGKGIVDIGWGLRYYLQNFLVRFDMGFSKEGTGIYFNFGHVF